MVAPAEHAPQNVMHDGDDVARFYDRCSDLMRALLDELAARPGRPRTFPDIEDALGWPRRRIASVLGGVARLRQREFGGRRPYRFCDERHSSSGRWELWMDAGQARAVAQAALPSPSRSGWPAISRSSTSGNAATSASSSSRCSSSTRARAAPSVIPPRRS